MSVCVCVHARVHSQQVFIGFLVSFFRAFNLRARGKTRRAQEAQGEAEAEKGKGKRGKGGKGEKADSQSSGAC